MTQAGHGLYAANGKFSSNACRKLMTQTIKNLQHGIRAKMVLKLTNKIKMAELKLTAAFTSRNERVSLNLMLPFLKQTFHHHLGLFQKSRLGRVEPN